jgi:hypothetical protein
MSDIDGRLQAAAPGVLILQLSSRRVRLRLY